MVGWWYGTFLEVFHIWKGVLSFQGGVVLWEGGRNKSKLPRTTPAGNQSCTSWIPSMKTISLVWGLHSYSMMYGVHECGNTEETKWRIAGLLFSAKNAMLDARGKLATGSMFLTFLDVYVKSREAWQVKLRGQILQCLCKHKNKAAKMHSKANTAFLWILHLWKIPGN